MLPVVEAGRGTVCPGPLYQMERVVTPPVHHLPRTAQILLHRSIFRCLPHWNISPIPSSYPQTNKTPPVPDHRSAEVDHATDAAAPGPAAADCAASPGPIAA